MAKMAQPLSEHLKSTMVQAFGKQREFTRQFEASFPVIQEKLISLANVQAGQSISVESLAVLAQDLQTIVISLRSLVEKGESAITEANIASMQLKEFEGTPAEVTESLVDTTQILANSDIWMQTSSAFIAQTVEMALSKPRREAISKLTLDALLAWYQDIVGELDKRQAKI